MVASSPLKVNSPSTDHLPIQVPRVKDKPRDGPSRITHRPVSMTIFQSCRFYTNQDMSQDGPTRSRYRLTSTTIFQFCRFSTNQDMSQDEPTRMGVTGPT